MTKCFIHDVASHPIDEHHAQIMRYLNDVTTYTEKTGRTKRVPDPSTSILLCLDIGMREIPQND